MNTCHIPYGKLSSKEEINIRSITGGNLHRLSFVFHILWNGTPTFWNYHSLILDTESYQLSTNGIESINRSIKHFLGLGMCNRTRLDKEMKIYHKKKVNLADAGLNHGRMKCIRRQTLVNQGSLSKSMKDFEKLSESRKLQNLHFHVLDCGTYTSEHCDPQYFDVLPLMEEIEVEPEISENHF